MEKLKVSIFNELCILEKYRLTPEEWFVVQLLFLGSSDERDPEAENLLVRLYKYGGITTTPIRDMLLSLQEKGIITKEYKVPGPNTIFDPEGIIFNKLFLKEYLKYTNELGWDLYSHYPEKYGLFQLNNITKIYPDIDYFSRAYGKIIRWNPETHEHIIEMLEWGKENNLITFSINEFIGTRKWIQLEKQRSEGISGELQILEEI